MKQTKMRLRVASAIFLMFAVAGVVSTAAPAGANSRGFTITNKTVHNLILESVTPSDGTWYAYVRSENVVRSYKVYSMGMDFEGRPADGSVLAPGQSARFELKWGLYSVYQAQLKYKVGTTGSTLVFHIATFATHNDSQCFVCPHALGVCSAKGVDLEYNGDDPYYDHTDRGLVPHTKVRAVDLEGSSCYWYPEDQLR